ncbi:predicted dehydrogenase [Chthonomonas calidirosea]|uniref:Gfo/Idh/MocA family protein n=1 Tax=Chthonomonas calidirosea TaxID=454171 RepID=UPI0006DD3BAE|nr:Gfo/Idh/MocA family oxidoreductase [Chthonomonas calidirosea]CEK13496.1 predicted dehydrogenase [Chthonomonas calidirosea]
MTSEVVRFGVIGVGGMGAGHCNMLSKIPEAKLTAVADADEAAVKAASEKFGVPGFTNHLALLESGLVDAVIIATPHYFHPPIAIDAFERGIHVLSEKPLAVTVSAADAMIAAARRSGRKFGIMYQMRSEPHHLAAKQIVESGALGEIYRTSLVMGWYRSQAYYNSGGWRATWAGEGGGVLINQAPHYLDLFCWLAGLPASLIGTTRTRLHDIEVEDEAYAFLTYKNGAHGYLYASTMEVPNHNLLEICADRGKIVIHGSRLQYFRVEGSIREFTYTTKEMWGSPKVTEEPVTLPEEKPLKGHAAITQNFARAILYNEPLLAPGEEGLNAMELINGIILSSKTQSPVELPVNRAAYDQLIEQLKAASKAKTNVETQRVTDPNFV